MAEKRELKALTIKCDLSTVQKFYEAHQKMGSFTQADTFARLVDGFFEQKQPDTDSAQRIEALQAELEQAKAAILQLEESGRTANDTHRAELEQAKIEFSTYKAANEPRENEYKIVILPDNLKALDYVCNRESQRRGQAWSRSHVINHFIYNRFILGNANGDLLSVSDGVCRKLGINPKGKTAAPAPTPTTAEPEPLTL